LTMRNYTRFIPGEEVVDAAQWSFGAVDTAALALAAKARAKEEAKEQAAADMARQEGYAQGLLDGRAQAMQEAQAQIAAFQASQGQEAARNFASLLIAADAQMGEAQQLMAQGVLELACEIARQILRQELSVNPDVLTPVIREALELLVADSKTAVVRLNPRDHEVIKAVLELEFPGVALALRADPRVSRGGCLVEAAGTVIDGSLEKRWARAVARLGLNLPWEPLANES
jgi:flagellar assembly protein FliH